MSEEENHIVAADRIYKIAENSLMAHTIRAMQHQFLRKGLGLNVQVEPDRDEIIEGNAISLLLSYINDSKLVTAKILIRKDASRQLARFCIAHEIYHLLLQLEDYDSQYSIWHGEKEMNRVEEDSCDGFAWHLCRKHNDFYFNEAKLKECRFSDKAVNFPPLFRTHDLVNIDSWPRPFILNPSHPFWMPLAA